MHTNIKQILKSHIRANFGDGKTAARAKEKAYQKVGRPTIIYVLEMLALTKKTGGGAQEVKVFIGQD